MGAVAMPDGGPAGDLQTLYESPLREPQQSLRPLFRLRLWGRRSRFQRGRPGVV